MQLNVLNADPKYQWYSCEEVSVYVGTVFLCQLRDSALMRQELQQWQGREAALLETFGMRQVENLRHSMACASVPGAQVILQFQQSCLLLFCLFECGGVLS